MLNSNNYQPVAPIEMPIDYLPVPSLKKAVIKKLPFTNNINYKYNKANDKTKFKQLSVWYNTYNKNQETSAGNTTTEIGKRKIKEFALQQRIIYSLNQLQYKPTDTIETFLFKKNSDKNILLQADFNVGHFENNHWLNTPGPVYTTQKANNSNAGKLLATTNIAGDENDTPIIYKQPFTQQETDLILLAAAVNDGENYCADGNKYWNKTNILDWWAKSDNRIRCITEIYKIEIFAPICSYATTNTLKQRPVPNNYKLWLDFYRYDMKQYLEWYILKLESTVVILPELTFDWCLKERLDKILNTKFLSGAS